MVKLYVVSGITDEDWEEIFCCLRFAMIFEDNNSRKDDIEILKNIKIRDLDQNNHLKKDMEKWLRQ